jgi:hypothetical protein
LICQRHQSPEPRPYRRCSSPSQGVFKEVFRRLTPACNRPPVSTVDQPSLPKRSRPRRRPRQIRLPRQAGSSSASFFPGSRDRPPFASPETGGYSSPRRAASSRNLPHWTRSSPAWSRILARRCTTMAIAVCWTSSWTGSFPTGHTSMRFTPWMAGWATRRPPVPFPATRTPVRIPGAPVWWVGGW